VKETGNRLWAGYIRLGIGIPVNRWLGVVNMQIYLLILRHCATSRKVAGSIPDGVFGFFSST